MCSSPSLPPEGDTINTSKKTLLELLLFRGCPCLAPCSSDGSALLGKNKAAHKYFLERKELQQLTSGSVHVHGHTPANGELHAHAAKQLCTHIHTRAQRHTFVCTATCTCAQTHVHGHARAHMSQHGHTDVFISRHMLAHVHTHKHAWLGARSHVCWCTPWPHTRAVGSCPRRVGS